MGLTAIKDGLFLEKISLTFEFLKECKILTAAKAPLDQLHQTLDILHLISEDALGLVWKPLWRCISITLFHCSECAGMRQLSQAQKSKLVHLKENRSALQFLI